MNRSLTILITLALFSCEREIDFDPGNVEQELVVSAFIQPGVVDSLLLTSTYSSLTSSDFFEGKVKYNGISGAKVVVLAEGDTVGCYVETKNRSYQYEGESFDENKEYQLEITHPDYPSISASTTVPKVPDFVFGTYPETGENVKQYFGDDILILEADIQVLLEFEDDEKANNYYVITAASTYKYTFKVGFPEKRDSIVAYTNPAKINSKSSIIEMIYHGTSYQFAQNNIDWESGYRVSEHELYFSDKLFNGQKVSIPLDVKIYGQRDTRHVLHLTLTSISGEYNQMLRSLAGYEKSNNGFFPEALQLYGNINNGLGIWGAKSSRTVSLDISGLDLFNYE
jgi:hypothetical protein